MFLEINNIDDAIRDYPNLQSIVDVFPGRREDNHTLERTIDWERIQSQIHNKFFGFRADYRVSWQERDNAPRVDYSNWDISRIIVVPHRTIKRVKFGLCPCINARYQNNDISPLTGRTAHVDHDDVHRLYNILNGVNENRRTPMEYGHINEREVDDVYVGESFNRIWESYERRYLDDRFWQISAKHMEFRKEAEYAAESLIYYVYFIIKDDDGNECCYVTAALYPVRQPNYSTAIQFELGDYLNNTRSAFYGFDINIKYNIYDKVLQSDWLFRSVRQYKECKICGLQVNKNHTVYAIGMAGASSRYSICFLCASTHTTGYDPNTEAFVRFYGDMPRESSTRRYLEHVNYQHNVKLMPFTRNAPTAQASSHYQWVDASKLTSPSRRGFSSHLPQFANEEPIVLSLEARKYLTWCSTEEGGMFEPDPGAYTSVGHVGNTFSGRYLLTEDIDEITTFNSCYGGLTFGNNPSEQIELTGNSYTLMPLANHAEIMQDYEEETGLNHGFMYLAIHRPEQWESYLASRNVSSAQPRLRQVIRVNQNPLYVARHGLPNLILAKQNWDFTFPVWQVDNARYSERRLIKPVGQFNWSNRDDADARQETTIDVAESMFTDDGQKLHLLSELGPFYGMELEIVGRRRVHNNELNAMENIHRQMVELFHPEWVDQVQKVQLVYRVADSSVDSGSPWGHELVSQALSLRAWQQVPEDFWAMLRENYVAMYKEGGGREMGNGIHIHLDHDSFSTGHLWAFLDYFYRIHHEVQNGLEWESTLLGMVAQRPTGRWAHWNLPMHYHRRRSLDDINKIIAATAVRRTHDSVDKYDGINFKKDSTIELRYFNSTTVKDRVLARLEFVDAVYHMTKNLVINELVTYNTYSAQQNEVFSDYFKDLTVSFWSDKLWLYVLSNRDNRLRYSNLIKLGKENRAYDLSRLFAEPSVNQEVSDHIESLEVITEEGGIH